MRKLSQQEVRQRMIRLRNFERLYPIARARIENLEAENRSLKKEVAMLKEIVLGQQKIIDGLKLQVEELRIMVFGKKKRPKNQGGNHFESPEERVPRTLNSYQRPVPNESEVTEVKRHTMDTCSCGAKTTYKKIAIFYEEDIPIPAKKIVRKHEVEKSYCPNCQQWQQAMPLPKAKVVLGPNIQKYACYLSIIARLSFAQIQNTLNDTYQIKISQGEIVKILNRQATYLRPFYEQLKNRIRSEPAIHLDETGWKLFIEKEKSYSWVMAGASSQESVFLIGESRGRHVENLIGKDYSGVVVTDDYGAYRKIENHQLCWAHLLRKFRDLADSGELEINQKSYCQEEYQRICLIYSEMKNSRNIERYDEFVKRLTDFSLIKPGDMNKMARLKTTLLKNIPNYLTCLKDENIPMTNNQAERSLRHLVLKRKISFGSLTKRTAENLAILLSALMSLRQRYQSNFFAEYLKV